MACRVEKDVPRLQLLNLKDSNDHLRADWRLCFEEFVNLFARLKFSWSELAHLLILLFLRQIKCLTWTEPLFDFTAFLLDFFALGRIPHVSLHRGIEVILRDTEILVKGDLNDLHCECWPLRQIHHACSESRLIKPFDRGTSFSNSSVFAFSHLLLCILESDLVGLKKVFECETTIGFECRFPKVQSFNLSAHLLDQFLRWLGLCKKGTLFRFFLGDDKLLEFLKLFVFLKVQLYNGFVKMLQVEAKLKEDGVRGLALLDCLDLAHLFSRNGALQLLHLAMHVHVSLEL